MELKNLNRTLRIASVILAISGFLDLALYFLENFHAPSWVLGVSWLAIALLLGVIPVTWRGEHASSK